MAAVAIRSASRPHADRRCSPHRPYTGAERMRCDSCERVTCRVERRSRLASKSAGTVTLWRVESGAVAPQHDIREMWVPRTRAQGRMYRHAEMLVRTRDAWTEEQTEVKGTTPSSRDRVGCWRREARRGRCGGCKDSIKEVGGGGKGWVHKIGSRGGRGRWGTAARRVSR